MKTFMAKTAEIDRKWYVIDAEDKVLGRLATEIATLLTGKHKPTYTPHLDTGDHVIVINAEKVKMTGNKLNQMHHVYHSEYPGGLKQVSYTQLLEEHPERIIEITVKGMMPKSSLGKNMFKKLKVYKGPDHKHEAQQPEIYEI